MEEKISMPGVVVKLMEITGYPQSICEDFLREFIAVITDTLKEGENVKIKGVGTFKLIAIESRKSVDIATGNDIEIPGHMKVVFVPSKEIAEAVNAPFALFEAVEVGDNYEDEEDSDEPIYVAADEEYDNDEDLPAHDAASYNAEDTAAEVAVPITEEEKDDIKEEVAESVEDVDNDASEAEAATSEPQIDSDAEIEAEEAEEEAIASEAEAKNVERSEADRSPEPPEKIDISIIETVASAPIATVENTDEMKRGEDHYSSEKNGNNRNKAEAIGEDKSESKKKKGGKTGYFKGFIFGFVSGQICLAIIIFILMLLLKDSFFDTDKATEQEQPAKIENTIPTDSAKVFGSSQSEEEPETASISENNDVDTSPSDEVRYDTITTTRFLTTLSSEYYGNFNFWPYIYEENKAILGHPNRIRPGTRVVIPLLSKYGIDPTNPSDLAKAKRLGAEIYKRYNK